MRVKLLCLFIILLCISGCGGDSGFPDITTPAAEKSADKPEPVSYEESLPAIIADLTAGLDADHAEFTEFMDLIDINSNTPTEDYEAFYKKISESAKISSNLTENERAALQELGLETEILDSLYDNLAFMRNTRENILTSIINNIGNSDMLAVVLQFYREYSDMFQIDLYYSVNLFLNGCTVEDESLTDFIKNIYPKYIERYSDFMQWETNVQVIDDKQQSVFEDLEKLVEDFSAVLDTTGDE